MNKDYQISYNLSTFSEQDRADIKSLTEYAELLETTTNNLSEADIKHIDTIFTGVQGWTKRVLNIIKSSEAQGLAKEEFQLSIANKDTNTNQISSSSSLETVKIFNHVNEVYMPNNCDTKDFPAPSYMSQEELMSLENYYSQNPYSHDTDIEEDTNTGNVTKSPSLTQLDDNSSDLNKTPGFTSSIKSLKATDIESMLQDFRRNKKDKIASGIENLDKTLYGGFTQNHLIVIAGQTGVGKTAFMTQLAYNTAKSFKTLYVSLEMSITDIHLRNIARECNLNFDEVETDTGDDKTNDSINSYLKDSRHDNLYTLDNSKEDLTIDSIEAEINALTCSNEHLVVFIDYLQLIELKETHFRQTQKDKMDLIVKNLRRLVKTKNITVIAIASINRSSYKDKIELDSFKESGSIEYSASEAIALNYNNLVGDIEQDGTVARQIELVILKSRSKIKAKRTLLSFTPDNFKFSNYTGVSLAPEMVKEGSQVCIDELDGYGE